MEHWGVPKLTWISRRIGYQAWAYLSIQDVWSVTGHSSLGGGGSSCYPLVVFAIARSGLDRPAVRFALQ